MRVFQKDDAFLSHLPCQGIVLRRVILRKGYLCIPHSLWRIEHPQLEACRHETLDRDIDLLFRDQTLRNRFSQGFVFVATGQITSCFYRTCRCFGCIPRNLVATVHITDRPAVRHDISPKFPFSPQDVAEEQAARAAGFAVKAVIRTHDRPGAPFGDAGLKGREVCFVEIANPGAGVKNVAQWLRTAVHGKVLRRGNHLEVLRIVPLQSFHERNAHPGGEKGIFSVCLLAASPSRITEDIDVWGPEIESR